MKNKIKLAIVLMIMSVTFGLGANAVVKTTKTPVTKAPITLQKVETKSNINESSYMLVNSLDVAANPTKYLNKKIKIKAKFDKFSALGLDYKPAYKSSEKYITFLIKRNDVTNHTIPLSEMKNFLERDTAEKYIDLKPGDDIEYCGVVFSNALGDAWVNVDKFTVLTQKPKEQKQK